MGSENGTVEVLVRAACACGHHRGRHKLEGDRPCLFKGCTCKKYDEAEQLHTTFRRCVNRLEVARVRSLVSEVLQMGNSYDTLRVELVAKEQDKTLDAMERNKAFEARQDLNRRFEDRMDPLTMRLYGELQQRAQGGHSPDDYDTDDLVMCGLNFVAMHLLSGDERKNLPGGQPLSSQGRPQPTVESAAVGSTTPKPVKS